MKQETLEAFERRELKKGASRRLRREGKIPAVMYGKDQNKTLSILKNEFEKKMHALGENTIIVLTLDDGDHEVLVKDYQEDTIRSFVTHVDFYEIEQGKELRTHIPVEVIGTPEGVLEGGVLEERLHEIEVECKPKDIPDKITIHVEGLQIGDTIHVEELEVPEGVKILNYPDQVVVTVSTQSEIIEPETEEEEGLEAEEGEEGAEGEEETEGEEGASGEESEE
ncbi:MAG: 50S ribosomal protein L25 [Spirochaetaceae bacterium]